MNRRVPWRAVLLAGLAAALASTVFELAAWWILADDPVRLVRRDVRFAAALLLGTRALDGGAPVDTRVLLAASGVHLGLSVAYAAVLAWLITAWRGPRALAAGAAFGVALYVLNMHALTRFFPWFAADRDAVTIGAHVAFGVVAAGVYGCLAHRPRA